MTPHPLISVIMNCYNSDRFLREAIDSVYAQTYDNWEIIFFDNASEDQSSEIAKSYDSRLKYYRNETTIPLGAARNLALERARGKYVCFLDCDDLYLATFLQKLSAKMEEGDFGMAYCSSQIINEHGSKVRKWLARNQSGMLIGKLLRHYEIKMVCVLIRVSVLRQHQMGFASNLTYNPDYGLFMEIASRYEVGVVPEILTKYRKSVNSLTSKSLAVVAPEMKQTLDSLFINQPEKRTEYAKDFTQAYRKLKFYDAAAALKEDRRQRALYLIFQIAFSKPIYFAIFLLILLPLPKSLTLRLLRR